MASPSLRDRYFIAELGRLGIEGEKLIGKYISLEEIDQIHKLEFSRLCALVRQYRITIVYDYWEDKISAAALEIAHLFHCILGIQTKNS